jgi:hypothetical protein
VRELEGAELDYWVARAQGVPSSEVEIDRGAFCRVYLPDEARIDLLGIVGEFFPGEWDYYQPGVWWHNGGPIIERERIAVMPLRSDVWGASVFGDAYVFSIDEGESDVDATGPTPLVAAMRAFVASKFGEEVPAP